MSDAPAWSDADDEFVPLASEPRTGAMFIEAFTLFAQMTPEQQQMALEEGYRLLEAAAASRSKEPLGAA